MKSISEAHNPWWLNPPDDRDIPQCERCGLIVDENDLDDDGICLDCRRRADQACVWYGDRKDMPAEMGAHNKSLGGDEYE